MTAGVLAGAGVALGVLLAVMALRPARLSLAEQLASYEAARLTSPLRSRGSTAGRSSSALSGWITQQLGESLVATLAARGWLPGSTDADLAVIGMGRGSFGAAKAVGAVSGLVLAAVPATLNMAATGHVSLLVPVWIGAGCALVGFLIPDTLVRSRARRRRRDFRIALGAYLDLVAMRMASGAGLAEALGDAARLGSGPAFAALRRALADARTDGLALTAALARLGSELALEDLVDTANRLQLVDTSGAQAEASLRAQAATLRDRELSDLRGTANERSQSMLVAQVVLGFGFLLFLGYPAVAKVLAS